MKPRTLSLASAVALLLVTIRPSIASPQQATGDARQTPIRPFVLFVHGRAQMERTDSEIVYEWVGALKKGLRNAGDSALIGRDDAGFVMYQHYFEKSPVRDSSCAGSSPTGPALAGNAIVTSAFRNAVPMELPRSSPGGVFLDDIRSSTNRISTTFINNAGVLVTTDTRTYLNFHSVEYCSVKKALEKGMAVAGNRPLIIVAHSMGTLAVYRELLTTTSAPGTRVVRFISLGSQLGFQPMVQQLAGKRRPPYPYPSVDSWVNIHDVADALAWPTYDAQRNLFDSGGVAHVPPIDVPITGARAHHSITAYLEHPMVVRAIASAWCEASVPKPASCSNYGFGDVGPGTGPPPILSWNEVAKRTARFGFLSGSFAVLGAWTATQTTSHASRSRVLIGAGVGAAAGSFISVAWSRWFPTI